MRVSEIRVNKFVLTKDLVYVRHYDPLLIETALECLEIFDKNSADKIQSKNYKGVNPPCLMPIRVKTSCVRSPRLSLRKDLKNGLCSGFRATSNKLHFSSKTSHIAVIITLQNVRL